MQDVELTDDSHPAETCVSEKRRRRACIADKLGVVVGAICADTRLARGAIQTDARTDMIGLVTL